ncbi:alginate lyase family protein [Microbacterium oleivorans]|uniref:Alginate lyase family protein n=1 Tax=Microbacterium oleivorans TaxID=273677 RepID=A0A7D5EXC8_9MICO|nr:alginate lyase family protein [Microbacterium oleivorans]QLD12004.1 alginate lyase family protein [Microbacterium oleivorans]
MRNRWRFSLAITAVVALAAPALPAAAAPTSPATTTTPAATFEDAFDELASHWFAAAGTWEASEGAATVVQPGAERGSILALTGRGLGDEATATVRFSTSGGGANAWAGFTVRRAGTADDYTQSGYTVFVRNSGELALIRAAGDGRVTVLATAQTDARPATQPVTLTARLDGDELSVGVGDASSAPLLTATDDAFDGSGFALAAHRDARMSVDAVALTGVVERIEPVPTDCVAWSGIPDAEAGRGDVLVSGARIDAVSSRIAAGVEPQASAYPSLLDDAEAGLGRSPAPPTTFFVPFFYNDPTAHRAARDGLQNDANTAYQLALAYRLSGDERYGAHAADFIDAWTSTVTCVRTREDSALAFSYHFPAFIHAAELLRGTDAWNAEAEAAFAGFLRETALPVAGSILHRTNNWGSWALETTTAAVSYLDDAAGIARAHARAVELIEHQIDADGHLPEEVDRNNGVGDYGIWYTHFSLLPLFLVAEALSEHGYDLHGYVNANGRGLADAADAATGWVADPTTFRYFSGDVADLANVRTIDYLRETGVVAHSMSYFELAQNHAPTPERAALLAEEGPMTTIHSAPYLSLTHGGLADATGVPEEPEAPEPTPGEPGQPGEPAVPGMPGGTGGGGGTGGASGTGGAGSGGASSGSGSLAAGADVLAGTGGSVPAGPFAAAVALTLGGLLLGAARLRRRAAVER